MAYNDTWKCPKCGNTNLANQKFCPGCGIQKPGNIQEPAPKLNPYTGQPIGVLAARPMKKKPNTILVVTLCIGCIGLIVGLIIFAAIIGSLQQAGIISTPDTTADIDVRNDNMPVTIAEPITESPITDSSQAASINTDDKPSYDITYNDCSVFSDSLNFVYIKGIVEITNTGSTDLYLSTGKFDIDKSDGSIFASESLISVYPQIISPGEKAYYFNVASGDNITVNDKLTIEPNVDVKKSTLSKIELDVTETSLTQEQYGNIKLIGRVQNNTQDIQNMIYIAVVLFDSSDKPIAVLNTFLVDDLKPGDKTGFEATGLLLPDSITPDSVARYEVYAYPYQLQF